MTIVVQGHVEKMERGQDSKIRLTIQGAAAYTDAPIVVLASKEELGGLYLPGVSVSITIRPIDGSDSGKERS